MRRQREHCRTPQPTPASLRQKARARWGRCWRQSGHRGFFFVSKATLEMPSWRVVSRTSIASPSRASSSPLMKIFSSEFADFSAASFAASASSDSSYLSR
jgi:hypothetical protein